MGCPHCGAEDTTDGTGICIQCGKPLGSSDTDATRPLAAPASTDFDLTRLPDASPPGTPSSGPDDATYLLPEARPRKSSARGPAPRSGPLTVGQGFGPRYRIIKLLGMGGMGAVYQAWDADLDVLVALKVIRPEVGSDPDETRTIERRFKQELLLARQVTHKNVVRIHDLGEIDGIKYITMSYIEGEDLASVLKREGQLPVPRALGILRQVVSGLVAAHEAGVVHRDLKPANIMIEGEHAIIMDFGIARSAAPQAEMPSSSSSDTAAYRSGRHPQQSTMAGTIVGTIAYMAPEQARGDTVDQRADVYAIGLIASDMLVGPRKRPQQTLEDLRRDSDDPPTPLRLIEPSVPDDLEAVVLRCLQRHPARRYQTTAELLAALNRLDDQGKKLPAIRRLTRRMVAATAVLGLVLLAATFYVTRIFTTPPVQPDPVSVVIADLDNRTGDPAFNRTLEPMLRRALEGAGFISAYDRNGLVRTLGVDAPERLDEMTAREIAVREGVGVVLTGSLQRDGDGYTIAVKATRTVTGEVVADATTDADTRDEIVEAATQLMTTVRTSLGDEASESAQMFAMASLSATSLDVVRHYAAAQEASSNGRFEDARADLLKAVEIDPKFGVGYQLLAVLSRNLGQLQAADKYINEALKYLDNMTERERLSTRGMYYRLTGDYPQCVKEYGELITRYEADVVGHNQRALCLTQLRDMKGAVDEMRQVVELLPNRTIFRANLALYANYAGDFQTAEEEARTIEKRDSYATLAIAFAQLGQGQLAAAMETYQNLATIDALGASFAASGFGDLAAVQGRFSDAVRILNDGAARDLAAKSANRAASKFAAVAYAELSRGRSAQAVAAIEKALANSRAVRIRFLAARLYVEAGRIEQARPLMAGLAAELQAEPQAYAKLVEGDIALKSGDSRLAIKVLSEANMVLDTWIGHFDLGRAYLDAGAFLQADSEFDRCLRRRGEALALFLDEEPTYAYLPSAYYYQGRVRDGLKIAGAAESYKNYLAFRGQSREDPLVEDARRRGGS
jgi:serine/threonine protein kinase/Flp pilus assembly protein TadD